MEFKQSQWLGKWINFENLIYSDETAIKLCGRRQNVLQVQCQCLKMEQKHFGKWRVVQ